MIMFQKQLYKNEKLVPTSSIQSIANILVLYNILYIYIFFLFLVSSYFSNLYIFNKIQNIIATAAFFDVNLRKIFYIMHYNIIQYIKIFLIRRT